MVPIAPIRAPPLLCNELRAVVGPNVFRWAAQDEQIGHNAARIKPGFPTLFCCRAAIEHMLPQGKGVIVNVSSIATRGLNRVPYGAMQASPYCSA